MLFLWFLIVCPIVLYVYAWSRVFFTLPGGASHFFSSLPLPLSPHMLISPQPTPSQPLLTLTHPPPTCIRKV